MQPKRVLLIGAWLESLTAATHLFSRAGFEVDVYSSCKIMRWSNHVKTFQYFQAHKEISQQIKNTKIDNYTDIILCDDNSIKEIKSPTTDRAIQNKLLPITAPEHIDHLYSKIGLSTTLSRSTLRTPKYKIITSPEDLSSNPAGISYPFFVKIDSSAGGLGVYECNHDGDVQALAKKPLPYPLLIQEKIIGTELMAEVFYKEGKIIYFAVSRPIATEHYQRGPTSVREYWHPSAVEPDFLDELSRLGAILGAHGFCSISIMEAATDKKRYYFEADMRPNAWIDHLHYTGFDTAAAVENFYENNRFLDLSRHPSPGPKKSYIIPYFNRLSLLQLAKNTHHVWSFFPKNESRLFLIYATLRPSFRIGFVLKKILSPALFEKIKAARNRLKNSKRALRRSD